MKINSLTTTSEVKNAFLFATQGENYVISSLSKKDTFFFQIDDPYFDMRVNSFKYREININLKVSLFQQREFDMGVSS